MKYLAALSLVLCLVQAATVKRNESYPLGIDTGDEEPSIDWTTVANNGIKFVYIEATNGISGSSPYYTSQYSGATNAGIIRGAYHFARPDLSSGTAQGTYFVGNGGTWTADGYTLPGALYLDANSTGDACYGLTPDEMVLWIQEFSETYLGSTWRYPVIYTTTSWWTECTDNSDYFGAYNPLWIGDWSGSLGPLPAGWECPSIWQYANHSSNPGFADYWYGNYSGLQSFTYSYSA